MRKLNDVSADAQAIEHLVADGLGIREIGRTMDWNFHRARQAFHLVTVGSLPERKRDSRNRKSASPEPSPETSPKKSPPTPDDIRARAAKDELTVPWSNWLDDPEQYGHWVREAGEPQEIYETGEDGQDQFVGVRVDPGILWPVGWAGPKTVADIPRARVNPRPAAFRAYVVQHQNMTPLHGPAYINLMAKALSEGAEFIACGQSYGKGLFETRKKKGALEVAPWSTVLADRVIRHRRSLPGDVELAAEMPVMPTTSRPLNGKHRYARGRRMIFAHPKREIKTVARPKGRDYVMMWTTGSITVPNYVLRQAGVMAVQDHQIGAVVVEVDFDGRVFVRDINCHPVTGAFYDLDVYVENGQVRRAGTVHNERGMYGPVIAWGDIHRNQLNPGCARLAWGLGGSPANGDVPMVDALRPAWQVMHDLLNFTAGSHHHERDPFKKVEKAAQGTNAVRAELQQAADLLVETKRDWCRTIVTYSNHDGHFDRWLADTDWRHDPVNAEFYLESALAKVQAVTQSKRFVAFEHAIRKLRPDADFDFVTADSSDCEIYGVGYYLHGDLNPNGARGSTAGLAQMGLKIVKEHDHQITVYDGVRSGGCMQGDDEDTPGSDYTVGPGSWVFGCTIGHPDGFCQSIPFHRGAWRA
jgi:hypothetical protein